MLGYVTLSSGAPPLSVGYCQSILIPWNPYLGKNSITEFMNVFLFGFQVFLVCSLLLISVYVFLLLVLFVVFVLVSIKLVVYRGFCCLFLFGLFLFFVVLFRFGILILFWVGLVVWFFVS